MKLEYEADWEPKKWNGHQLRVGGYIAEVQQYDQGKFGVIVFDTLGPFAVNIHTEGTREEALQLAETQIWADHLMREALKHAPAT